MTRHLRLPRRTVRLRLTLLYGGFFRHAAGLSQALLADRIGYSATAVAHAELGRRPVSAEFWELADDVLAADGNLTAQGIRIKDPARTRREEQRQLDKAGVRRARFPGHQQMSALPAAGHARPAPGPGPGTSAG